MASDILHENRKDSLLSLYEDEEFIPGKIVTALDSFFHTFHSDNDIDETIEIKTENIDIHCKVANVTQDFNLTIDAKGSNYTSDIHINFPSSAFLQGLEVLKLVAASYSGLNDVLMVSDENSNIMYELASPVVSILAQTNNSTFDDNVLIVIPTDRERKKLDFSCQWIENITNSTDWSEEGCSIEYLNERTMKCSCNHLTNFAILVSLSNEELQFSDEFYYSIEIITYVGCAVSLFSLFLAIIVLLWLKKELNSGRYLIVRNMSVALFLAQIIFVTATPVTKNKVFCSIIAGIQHYLWLSVFAWMLSHGIHLYIKVQKNLATSFKDIYFYIIGWGSPIIIVGITAAVNPEGYGTESNCWLSVSDNIWAFIAPAILTIFVNTLILIIVIKVFLGIKNMKSKSDQERIKGGLKAAIILMPVLGLTWLFGFFSFNEQTLMFQYLFAILNSLQGFFIFIFHVVLNSEVKKAVLMKQKKKELSETSSFGLFKMFRGNVVDTSEKSDRNIITASTALEESNRS